MTFLHLLELPNNGSDQLLELTNVVVRATKTLSTVGIEILSAVAFRPTDLLPSVVVL